MARPALVPELYVSDLDASLGFYVGLLGFRVQYERPEQKFAALSLGEAHLMIEEAPSLQRATPKEFSQGQWRTASLARPFGRGVNFEIEVSDLAGLHERICSRSYPRLLELHHRSYRVGDTERQVRQLLLADPDGYLLRLSEPTA